MAGGRGSAMFAIDYAKEKGALNKDIMEANEAMQDYAEDMDKIRLATKFLTYFTPGGAGTDSLITAGIEGIGETLLGKNLEDDIAALDAFDHEGKKFNQGLRTETSKEVDTMVDTLRWESKQSIMTDTYAAWSNAGGIRPGDKLTVEDIKDFDLDDSDIGKYYDKDTRNTFDTYWDYLTSADFWWKGGK